MPTFKNHLDKQELWKAAQITLKGQDEEGEWKTAQAKAYPKRLSLAIADAMIEAALKPLITHGEQETHAILASMQPYAPQEPSESKRMAWIALTTHFRCGI